LFTICSTVRRGEHYNEIQPLCDNPAKFDTEAIPSPEVFEGVDISQPNQAVERGGRI
jgi:hypothetical protein